MAHGVYPTLNRHHYSSRRTIAWLSD